MQDRFAEAWDRDGGGGGGMASTLGRTTTRGYFVLHEIYYIEVYNQFWIEYVFLYRVFTRIFSDKKADNINNNYNYYLCFAF